MVWWGRQPSLWALREITEDWEMFNKASLFTILILRPWNCKPHRTIFLSNCDYFSGYHRNTYVKCTWSTLFIYIYIYFFKSYPLPHCLQYILLSRLTQKLIVRDHKCHYSQVCHIKNISVRYVLIKLDTTSIVEKDFRPLCLKLLKILHRKKRASFAAWFSNFRGNVICCISSWHSLARAQKTGIIQ